MEVCHRVGRGALEKRVRKPKVSEKAASKREGVKGGRKKGKEGVGRREREKKMDKKRREQQRKKKRLLNPSFREDFVM